jgi:hypothetical protein
MTVSLREPVLTEAEWTLILELLSRERRDLPIEIHHTRTRKYRDQLRQRLRLIEQILERLEPVAA